MCDRTLVVVIAATDPDRADYLRSLTQAYSPSSVLTAPHGPGGLALCQQRRPLVVLLDWALAQPDGPTFLAQLEQGWGDSPAVVIGLVESPAAAESLRGQGIDILIKAQLTAEGLVQSVRYGQRQADLQRQLLQQRRHQQLGLAITQRIHRRAPLADLLAASVEELRQGLQADRVLLYQRAADGGGAVAAVAAQPPWPTCAPSQLETLYTGQPVPQAIADVSQAPLPQAQISGFQALQVKASLAVPIQLEGSGSAPWGLLVVHQCATPRRWQEAEVHLLDQLAMQLAIAIRQADQPTAPTLRADQALSNLQQKLAFHIENTPLGTIVWDEQFRVQRWSSKATEIFGWQEAEVVGKTMLDWPFIHEPDLGRVKKEGARLLSGGQRGVCYNRNYCKDGRVIDCEWFNSAQIDAQGNLISILSLVQDISQRKQADAALRQSESQNRAIIAAIPDLLLRVKPDGTYLSCIMPQRNLDAQKFLPKGHRITEVIPLEQSRHLLRAFQQAITTGKLQVIEHAVPKYGKLTHEEVRIVACSPDELLVIIRDISDRKQAEADLERSETLFRAIYEQAAVGIAQVTLAGEYVRSNQRFDEFLGFTPGELLGKTFQDFSHPEDLKLDLENVARLVKGEIQAFSMEKRFIRQDGQRVWGNLTVSPMRDETGAIQYLLGIVEDISKRKQLEAERECTEVALRQSEAKQRALLSALPDLIMRISREGIYLDFVATTAFSVIGDTGDFVGHRLEDTLPPNLAAQRLAAIAAALDTGTIQIYEQEIEVGGKRQTEEIRVVACENDALVVVRDISDRKQAELALQQVNEDLEQRVRYRTKALVQSQQVLQEQAQFLRSIYEGVSHPIFVDEVLPNGDFRHIAWNPAGERVTGLVWTEAIGKSLEEIHGVAEAAEIRRNLQRCVAEGQTISFEEHRSFEGQDIWTLTTLNPLQDSTGAIYRVVGTALDITARKQAEAALRDSEERLRLALAATNQGMYDLNVQTGEAIVSPEYATMLGYDPEGFHETNARWLARLHPDDQTHVAKTYHAYMSGELSEYKVEFRQRTQSGDWKWVLSLGRIVAWDSQGQPLRLLGIHTDISERKQAEAALHQINADLEARVEARTAELKQAMEAAEAANLAKSTFLANMSHELRTPLNAILGFSQLLARHTAIPPKQQEQLAIINQSGEHLLGLINDILEMSKIEAGRVTFKPSPFDLYALLDGLAALFQLRASDKGLRLICDRTSNLPQYVQTDENKLRQVLINLLGNAVKFTQRGWVALRVGLVENSQAKTSRRGRALKPQPQRNSTARQVATEEPLRHTWPLFHFVVEDTGPGIDADELDSLFEPFVQSKKSPSQPEGSGLGLPISQQFVRMLGGELLVSSDLENGALFSFAIPMAVVEAEAVSSCQVHRRVVGLAPGQPHHRILLVDDNWSSRQLMLNLLEPLGYQVEAAVNGEEALALWTSWQPHLIWMDIRMPQMNGYEATRQIRQREAKGRSDGAPPSSPTIIIALTAGAFEEDRIKVLEAGCDDFVRKPLQDWDILAKMAQHLGIEYCYEDSSGAASPVLGSSPPDLGVHGSPRPPLSLQDLPRDWVEQFYQAVIQLDAREILTLIGHIAGERPNLAQALKTRLEDFDFELLLTLTEEVLGSKE